MTGTKAQVKAAIMVDIQKLVAHAKADVTKIDARTGLPYTGFHSVISKFWNYEKVRFTMTSEELGTILKELVAEGKITQTPAKGGYIIHLKSDTDAWKANSKPAKTKADPYAGIKGILG